MRILKQVRENHAECVTLDRPEVTPTKLLQKLLRKVTPVNIVKFFRTSIMKNICKWLSLNVGESSGNKPRKARITIALLINIYIIN